MLAECAERMDVKAIAIKRRCRHAESRLRHMSLEAIRDLHSIGIAIESRNPSQSKGELAMGGNTYLFGREFIRVNLPISD